MANNRHFYSNRGFELVYYGDRPEKTTLSVENYCKWYDLYVIYPDGYVSSVPFWVLDDTAYCRNDVPFVDHVPNPKVVVRYAQLHGWNVSEQSLEMMIGRWELEGKAKSEYSDILE